MATLLLLGLVIWNCITFIAMWRDKRQAIMGRWRTPESTLLLYGALMGAPGLWFGMKLLRHKTQHNKFAYGIPALWVANCICLIGVYYLNKFYA